MTTYSVLKHCQDAATTMQELIRIAPQVELVAKEIVVCLTGNGTVFWFGNGGSASDAEHLAAELSGKFAIDREPLNSVALTCNSSVVTAIANDYGFDQIFSRQVKAHVRSGDVVIGISTSGKSVNVLNGLKTAIDLGAISILLTGKDFEGALEVTHIIRVPSSNTAHIQEAHITVGQAICGFVENEML